MNKLIIFFLLINVFSGNMFAEIKYGENVVIYQENGSILNFLYAEFYQSKNELKIRNDRHINLDSKNVWILFDPDNLNNISNIKYGDKIKLAIYVSGDKFYINQKSDKTKIKKRKKKNLNDYIVISSYYDLNPKKETDLDSQTIQNVGVFKIVNPLNISSTDEVDDSKPVILVLEIDGQEDEYLVSTGVIDIKPNIWYIKPERLL